MSDLDVLEPAAKPDNMVDPAFLAASMIDERAPDIVEAVNDVPAELAPRFAASAARSRHRSAGPAGAGPRTRNHHADAAGDRRKIAGRGVGRPGGRHLPPGGRAALHRTARSAGCRYPGQHPPAAAISQGHRRIDHDDGIRQRAFDLYGAADPRLYPPRGKQPGNRLRDLRAGSRYQEAGQDHHTAPADHRRSGSAGALGGPAGPIDHRHRR